MEYLSTIQQPIKAELAHFIELFETSLQHGDGLLGEVLSHIRQRGGKRLRPILIFLVAKNFGKISEAAQHAAVGLELLHTASLVHDDVVDDSAQRRGQASVNANYNNKVAVLVGDYILSTALLYVSYTHSEAIVQHLANLGRTLSEGEIIQLSNIQNLDFSEDVYFRVIEKKTAALFKTCALIGAEAAGASKEAIAAAENFGEKIGVIFQIRDDIFDYFPSKEIGKPTGNDMAEGKLTLPVLYALNTTGNKEMQELAKKVKKLSATADEIARLVTFTIESGGISYAERVMDEYYQQALSFIREFVHDSDIAKSLEAYLDYVIQRNL